MANRIVNQAVFVGPVNDVENTNVASLDYPGQLGAIVRISDKTYQLIQVSAGAASPAPADGILAFWVTRGSFIVGNDDESEGGGNAAAGIFHNAITVSQYGFIQTGGSSDNVLTNGTSGDVATVAEGTAATLMPVGYFTVAASGNRSSVHLILNDLGS
jgi:hypothetical protein